MVPGIDHRGCNWMVVLLLIAAAPMWCCCATVLAHVAPEQEPVKTCGSCQPAETTSPCDTDQPDEEPCDCEHEKLVLMVPDQSDVQRLAGLSWDTAPVWLAEPAPAIVGGAGLSPDSLSAAKTAPLPGVASLFSLRCLLTT
ncbi:MAG: hypothetical protein WD294_08650 [Phycisphaeraceae bacterium]